MPMSTNPEKRIEDVLKEKPTVCAMLMGKVKAYYADEAHEAEFRKWYEEKYGYEYKPEKWTAVRS